MPCSRIPKCIFATGKVRWSKICVCIQQSHRAGARSAEPPINQGRLGAIIFRTLPLLTRVANPFSLGSKGFSPASQPAEADGRTRLPIERLPWQMVFVVCKQCIPLRFRLQRPACPGRLKILRNFFRNKEFLTLPPTIGFLGQLDFVITERRAVGTVRVCLVGLIRIRSHS